MGRLQGLGNPDELQQVNPDPIQLIDNRSTPVPEAGEVWASDVHVDDYSLIQGSTKAGAYVVWTIHIDAVSNRSDGAGGVITIRKRYSEFDVFREQLRYAFPDRRNEIPDLPPKSVVSKFRTGFLEARRKGLEYFLLCVLLNPVFARSPIVKKFVRG